VQVAQRVLATRCGGRGGAWRPTLRGLVFPAPTGGAATVTVPYVFRAGE